MTAPGKAVITVNVEADSLRKIIADAIEENMALPLCDREHVEPMAEWERELLDATDYVPRVVKDRTEFRVGQLIAMTNPATLATVVEAEGRRVLIEGKYLKGEEARGHVSSPYDYEIEKGLWVILDSPRESRR